MSGQQWSTYCGARRNLSCLCPQLAPSQSESPASRWKVAPAGSRNSTSGWRRKECRLWAGWPAVCQDSAWVWRWRSSTRLSSFSSPALLVWLRAWGGCHGNRAECPLNPGRYVSTTQLGAAGFLWGTCYMCIDVTACTFLVTTRTISHSLKKKVMGFN